MPWFVQAAQLNHPTHCERETGQDARVRADVTMEAEQEPTSPASRSWKRHRNGLSLRASGRKRPCRQHDCRSSDAQHEKVIDLGGFEASAFMVVHSNGDRKRIRRLSTWLPGCYRAHSMPVCLWAPGPVQPQTALLWSRSIRTRKLIFARCSLV